MDSLTSITGNMKINNLRNSLNIPFLNSINLGGNLYIHDNEYKLAMKTLNGSLNINGYLSIEDNHGLIDMSGFGKVKVIDSILINYNSWIILFDLSSLTYINGNIHIFHNHKMEYPNFASLKSIGGYLVAPQILKQGESLKKYFPKLRQVKDKLIIMYCDNLINLRGFNSITYVGSLYVGENKKLKYLEGLDNLKIINGSLEIVENRNLSKIKLDKLKFVKSILMKMTFEARIKEISFGRKGSNLGYPYVAILSTDDAKHMTLKEIRKSFSSICKVVSKTATTRFICNQDEYEYGFSAY